MAYCVDRQRALRMEDIVVIRPVRKGRERSQVILKDNSLYGTLTRARTFLRACCKPSQGFFVTV